MGEKRRVCASVLPRPRPASGLPREVQGGERCVRARCVCLCMRVFFLCACIYICIIYWCRSCFFHMFACSPPVCGCLHSSLPCRPLPLRLSPPGEAQGPIRERVETHGARHPRKQVSLSAPNTRTRAQLHTLLFFLVQSPTFVRLHCRHGLRSEGTLAFTHSLPTSI